MDKGTIFGNFPLVGRTSDESFYRLATARLPINDTPPIAPSASLIRVYKSSEARFNTSGIEPVDVKGTSPHRRGMPHFPMSGACKRRQEFVASIVSGMATLAAKRCASTAVYAED